MPALQTQADDLATLMRATLTEYKGLDIILLDLRGCNSFTDLMLLCTATSTRHVAALGKYVIKTAKEHKCPVLGIEGEKYNEWIAIDLGAVVVHLMLADVREYYAIEKIWSA
ncbi:MAG: ribosome silencing factor [Gammaproteobacteria bacterium]|nr:ribosome silencing factor [Pseudomonadota bacterium]MCH9662704.1 ribosome silencing factor [Gammaproteobacteria bacterium]